MPIDNPVSDLTRSKQHNPADDWPVSVTLRLMWHDHGGRPIFRTEVISSDMFFGRNGYGAPLTGEHVIQAIERLRRLGPPEVKRRGRRHE